MSVRLPPIFSSIPQQEFNTAVTAGLLLAAAASIFYFFFGRLYSLPELLSITLKNPTSSSSRNSLIVIAGFVFFSAILRTLYHQHINGYFPFDNDLYLKKISTLRLIISGALVGLGSQLAINGNQNTGIMGTHRFTINSVIYFFTYFGVTMLTVTYKLAQYIPKTPRIIEIANKQLPRNISFDSYLLVTLLTPFICFLISSRKSLKGMIESLLHFGVGIISAGFFMLLGWSTIQTTLSQFSFSKTWTGESLVSIAVSAVVFSVVHLIVRYGFKKPLFSNELLDKKMSLTLKCFLGHVLLGLGFGMGGLLFESFLLTVPSSEIRIAVFWGLPCVFAMKAVQVLSQKSELPPVPVQEVKE